MLGGMLRGSRMAKRTLCRAFRRMESKTTRIRNISVGTMRVIGKEKRAVVLPE